MKGTNHLKHLISARKLYLNSKKGFHSITFYNKSEWTSKKSKMCNIFDTFQMLTVKRLLSLQLLENKELQNALLSVGFTNEEIESDFNNDSDLLKYSPQKLHNVGMTLLEQGMPINDVKKIFLDIPHIVEVNTSDLNRTINKWREFKLSEEKMFRNFAKFPLFLLLAPDYIDDRLKKVLLLFTNSDVIVLLETMPSLFIDDWDMITRKLHYIQSFMGFTQIQMMRTSVFEHSLMHIKTRHMFISLSGVFKPRNPKKIILNNPSLKCIVDSTDQDFVRACGLTLEEYYMFCDIMAAKEIDDEID